MAHGGIYTLGYTGWKPADIKQEVEQLHAVLLDIRFSPTSRHPQWSKKQLSALLGERYMHSQALGNRNYKGGPTELVDYEAGKALVVSLLEHGTSVILMCACPNVATCHRLEVATRLEADLGSWAEAVHLFHR